MTRHFRGQMPTAPVWHGAGCSSTLASPSPPVRNGMPAASVMAGAGRPPPAQAWTAFWQEQGVGSRCLDDVHPDVRQMLNDHWSAFAATLAPCARILDIGCGAGAVGRPLLAACDSLRVTGIDLADVPAPGDRRIALLPGTPMEKLPFGRGSFDAAVSQFGFEYGNIREAARELARVLVPGAPFFFVVHHADSSIVHRNLTRNRALRGLMSEAVRRAFVAANEVELDRQIWSIRRGAPDEAIVGEVAQALRTRLGRSREQRAAIWSAVAAALVPERAILDALEASCVAPGSLDRWLAGLAGRFEIRTACAMRRPTRQVIAWKVEGVKSEAA